jgi:hypothetical protein
MHIFGVPTALTSAVPGTDRYERLATARDDSRPAALRYVGVKVSVFRSG